MKTMTISNAARQAEVGIETIRFYERRGLIEQPPKPACRSDAPWQTTSRSGWSRQQATNVFSWLRPTPHRPAP